MTIDLHIERLVLEGIDVPFAQRPHVAAAIEAELALMIRNGGLDPRMSGGIAVPALSAPPATLAPDANPAQIGGAIATSLYGGLGGKS